MHDIGAVIPVRNDPLLPNAVWSVPEGAPVVISLTRPDSKTRKLAADLAQSRLNTVVIEVDKVGMAAGVNAGMKALPVPKAVILDSDCELASNALDEFSKALETRDFVRGVVLPASTSKWAQVSQHGQLELNRQLKNQPLLIGPGIAVVRDEFLKVDGGYDEQMRGSCDYEFAIRLNSRGCATGFATEATVYHQPITFKIDLHAHMGYGAGMRYIDMKHGGRFGLRYCANRLSPSTVVRKIWTRGFMSGPRSLLLGTVMLWKYFASDTPITRHKSVV